MATHKNKKYLESRKLVEDRSYAPQEAVELIKKASFTKFDETVELHLRTGMDPKNAAQQIRGVTLLPHGLGKVVRILVFSQGEGAKIALDAGADYVGGDDIAKKIEEGWLEFDIAIATPDIMGRVGRLGKILGRRGLMPNPKTGTVANASDLPRIIEEARKGRVEYKLDKGGVIHLPLGKVSFSPDKLMENLSTIVETIVKAKPSGAKGQYIKSAYLTTTMGPSVELDLKTTLSLTAT
ncbi:MAG: 50S ribosomal protein L1 [Dehalococcoidia bacterium]|nr:50S ribosomal protein L1 [Dehalococcoidia bacterium]